MNTITFQPFKPGTTDSAGNSLGSIDPRLSRTNYFDGQLLKASDLTRDQIYLDERLLEMGQVLGSGIATGLEVTLVDNHKLQVQPGIAVAPSGRVLQLSGKTLEIDLQDSGFITDLNKGKYRRFNRGLYAIALNYAEVVDGVAETYPADLVSQRKMLVSSFAEGVELALIPLNLTLPRGDDIAVRAALAQQLIGRGGRIDLPTDEAIAIGLIAIDQARPLWLDLGLLRRPLRRPNLGNALQLDLATHYRELFADVLAARQSGGRRGDFAASSYFRLLPPFGPLPKEAIDPVTGRQGYFPKDYDVAIAPVRRADLASIIEESSQLAPMDLERDADADIMVLVPMSDQEFALRGRQLEQSARKQLPVINKLPFFNSLALRLFTQPPAHHIDTDAAAWKDIWEGANPDELIYVRRPPRTAETNVSAVVLAQGFELPPVTKGLPPDAASLETQLDKALEESVNAKAELDIKASQEVVLKKKISDLEARLGSNTPLSEALAQVQILEAELAAAEAEVTALKSGENNAAILANALAATSDKIAKLSAELDLAHKKIAELQAGTGAATDEEAQHKIKELAAALEAANSAESALKDERDAAQLRLAEATQKFKTLSTELDVLKKKLDESNSGAATGDADLTAAKKEIEKLNQQAVENGKLIDNLQADLVKAQKAQAAAESDSKDALLKLTDAIKQAEAAKAESNTRAQELTKSKELVTSLLSQIKTSDAKVADLQTQLAQRPTLRSAFPLVELAKIRGADPSAAEKLEAAVGDNTEVRLAVIQLLALTPAQFDKALWPSLVSVARKPENLPLLRDAAAKALEQGLPIAQFFLDNGANLGLSATDLKNWRALAG